MCVSTHVHTHRQTYRVGYTARPQHPVLFSKAPKITELLLGFVQLFRRFSNSMVQYGAWIMWGLGFAD